MFHSHDVSGSQAGCPTSSGCSVHVCWIHFGREGRDGKGGRKNTHPRVPRMLVLEFFLVRSRGKGSPGGGEIPSKGSEAAKVGTHTEPHTVGFVVAESRPREQRPQAQVPTLCLMSQVALDKPVSLLEMGLSFPPLPCLLGLF